MSWAVSHSIIPLHYLQQPSMNKFIELLRSVDNIKAGNLISLFIRHCKIVQFMQIIMAVSVPYVYCFSLYAFGMNNITCVNYTLQNCLVYTIYNGCTSARARSLSLSLHPTPTNTQAYTHIHLNNISTQQHMITSKVEFLRHTLFPTPILARTSRPSSAHIFQPIRRRHCVTRRYTLTVA